MMQLTDVGGALPPLRDFVLPPELEAREPAETRGQSRADVRLLVTRGVDGHAAHARFTELGDFLKAGDLLVVNESATLPAALSARTDDGQSGTLHVSTRLPAELFIVEPRKLSVSAKSALRLAGGAVATLLARYRNSKRLWIASLDLTASYVDYLKRWGKPITYPYMARSWSIDMYQTVYAGEAGSAEMPSAGRPFTLELLAALQRKGVGIVRVVHHAGVASLERDEPPHEEYFAVPPKTAAAIAKTKVLGGRVIAVGTTVVRAVESATEPDGTVYAARGWTDLLIGVQRPPRAIDALLTGFHEPRSTHLELLRAIAGNAHVGAAYRTALQHRYLWHEFGDSHLILP